jgi:ABC-type antimicrobial peptide transport system permease subunit
MITSVTVIFVGFSGAAAAANVARGNVSEFGNDSPWSTTAGAGDVGDNATVYQGEDNIVFNGSRDKGTVSVENLERVSGDNAGVQLELPIPTDQVTGEYSNDNNRGSSRSDFTVTVQSPKITGDGLTILVVFIAAVSLVVAGLGIANTMLVSVMERTREIGVLRALGFERSAVRWLFVLEAGLTGLLGGLAGVTTGVGFTYLVTTLVSPIGGGGPEGPGAPEQGPPGGGEPQGLFIEPALPVELLVGVVVFATVVSVVAGLLPARKAAKLDPVEALRSE